MVATTYPMKVSDALLATALESPPAAIDRVNVLSHATIAAKPAYPGPSAWLHGANRALMQRMQAGRPELNLFHHDFTLCGRYANGLDAAAKVACPATLVLGEHDQMTLPPGAIEIAKVLRARIVTLPGGHSLMQEQPDGLLAALRSALL